MRQEKKVILLAGPTASGKSKLAIKLAQYFDGEIINADSMQIYKEISILTSKPNSQDIKHHLYGFNSHDLKDMNYMNIVFLYERGRLTKNLIKPLYIS